MADYLNAQQVYNWAIDWIRSNVLIATNAEQLVHRLKQIVQAGG
jgi:hypothetical protein